MNVRRSPQAKERELDNALLGVGNRGRFAGQTAQHARAAASLLDPAEYSELTHFHQTHSEVSKSQKWFRYIVGPSYASKARPLPAKKPALSSHSCRATRSLPERPCAAGTVRKKKRHTKRHLQRMTVPPTDDKRSETDWVHVTNDFPSGPEN